MVDNKVKWEMMMIGNGVLGDLVEGPMGPSLGGVFSLLCFMLGRVGHFFNATPACSDGHCYQKHHHQYLCISHFVVAVLPSFFFLSSWFAVIIIIRYISSNVEILPSPHVFHYSRNEVTFHAPSCLLNFITTILLTF